MADVFLDGEKVDFSGAPPATLGALHALLENALAEQNRVPARLLVDGREWAGNSMETALAAIGRVEVESLTLAAAVGRIAAAAVGDLAGARDSADALACEVLRVPWAEARDRCIAVAERLGRVLEGATTVAVHAAELTPAVQAFAATIDPWMDAVRAEDAATIALLLDGRVLPALAGLDAALAAVAPADA